MPIEKEHKCPICGDAMQHTQNMEGWYATEIADYCPRDHYFYEFSHGHKTVFVAGITFRWNHDMKAKEQWVIAQRIKWATKEAKEGLNAALAQKKIESMITAEFIGQEITEHLKKKLNDKLNALYEGVVLKNPCAEIQI